MTATRTGDRPDKDLRPDKDPAAPGARLHAGPKPQPSGSHQRAPPGPGHSSRWASLRRRALYAALAFQDARDSQAAPAAVEVTRSEALPAAPYVVFRNTASGQGFGEAATVPL